VAEELPFLMTKFSAVVTVKNDQCRGEVEMAKKNAKTHEFGLSRMPGYTAEASLTKTKQHYSLAPAATADAERVIPQGLFINPTNGHLIYCYDEGGFSGCVDLGYRGPITLM
jgi:hypothetical protein